VAFWPLTLTKFVINNVATMHNTMNRAECAIGSVSCK
jgi:hypothetical protein